MSDYKAKMKAWAVDRVISMVNAGMITGTIKDLSKMADELVEYAYSPAEDFTDACGRISEILLESPDAIDKCNFLIAELESIKVKVEQQIGMAKAATHEAAHA